VNHWFWLRVGCRQLLCHARWLCRPLPWATRAGDPDQFPHVVADRESPLRRAPDAAIAAYTEEKTHNLALAVQKIDGLAIGPGEVFSFCRRVGKTTRRQGYRPALELIQGRLSPEIGGGLCQLSNLLFLLALDINAEIVERHRHGYDLFRDVERTVPFGCGATVFYNYVDFQFRNTLPFPVLVSAAVASPVLRARVLAPQPLPFQVKIIETDARFFRRNGEVYRANRLWKEVDWRDGSAPARELLSENECRVLYPADDLVERSDGSGGEP